MIFEMTETVVIIMDITHAGNSLNIVSEISVFRITDNIYG